MVLRQHLTDEQERWKIVGDCYVCGLEDGDGLLGRMQKPWTANWDIVRGESVFHNNDTGFQTPSDPRLGPIEDWEMVDKERTGDDPICCVFFKHKETGEVISYDPRLDPEPLKARGVKLETFKVA